jgi:hypothetical protein
LVFGVLYGFGCFVSRARCSTLCRAGSWAWQGRGDWGEKAYKALCGCAKCHAGQIAFWSAFVCDRDVFEAFTVFVLAVFVAWFLERLQAKMER